MAGGKSAAGLIGGACFDLFDDPLLLDGEIDRAAQERDAQICDIRQEEQTADQAPPEGRLALLDAGINGNRDGIVRDHEAGAVVVPAGGGSAACGVVLHVGDTGAGDAGGRSIPAARLLCDAEALDAGAEAYAGFTGGHTDAAETLAFSVTIAHHNLHILARFCRAFLFCGMLSPGRR